ncbi:hypothetical protein THASP1DRAFT_33626, partial [Thamnocephalis sphaerospora]
MASPPSPADPTAPLSMGRAYQIQAASSSQSLNSVYSAQSYPSSHVESIGALSDSHSTPNTAVFSPALVETPPHSATIQSPSGAPTLRARASTMFSMTGSAGSISAGSSGGAGRIDPYGQVSDKSLLKKAKGFLDDRQRTKARFQSLCSFVDAAHSMDQALFFQEHAEIVFAVVVSMCESHIHKIKSRTVKPANFASKDIQSLLRALALFRRILLYLPDRLRAGWRSEDIGLLLLPLLDHGNHIRLRLIGFRLLLLWMRSTPELDTAAAKDILCLFADAVPLGVFASEVAGLQHVPVPHAKSTTSVRMPPLPIDPSAAPENPDLILPATQAASSSDALLMLRIALDELVMLAELASGGEPGNAEDDELAQLSDGDTTPFCGGINAAQRAMFHLANHLNNAYLLKLLPGAALADTARTVPEIGFSRCPPSFLRLFISFLLTHTILPPHGPLNRKNVFGSATVMMLSKAIGSDPLSRAIRQEAVDQALTLRPMAQYQDIMRASLYMATAWIVQPESSWPMDMRPTKLERPIASVPEDAALDEQAEQSVQSYQAWNKLLVSYVDWLLMPLELIPEDEESARSPLKMHRLSLSLMRVMVAANAERLQSETWKHILNALLSVQSMVMAGRPRYSSKVIDSLIGMLVKTIYVSWARSKTSDPDIWAQLCVAMQRYILWPQVIRQWGKMVLKMTRVIIKEVYGIDTKKLDQDLGLPKLLRKKKDAMQRRLSLVSGAIPKSGIEDQLGRSLRKRHSASPVVVPSPRPEESATSPSAYMSGNTVATSDDETPRVDRKRTHTHNTV